MSLDIEVYEDISIYCTLCKGILILDQPPAYPYNDKPPDYRDVCPRKTVSPPPVDIPSPENTPAVHIPLSTTTTAASSVVYSSNTTTTTTTSITTTRYPPKNIVVTQPLSYNAHLDDVDEVSDNSISNSCNTFLRFVFD